MISKPTSMQKSRQIPTAKRIDQSYDRFLNRKRQLNTDSGFEPLWMPEFLYPFQSHLVDWAIRKGRGAMFADCGLGNMTNALSIDRTHRFSQSSEVPSWV